MITNNNEAVCTIQCTVCNKPLYSGKQHKECNRLKDAVLRFNYTNKMGLVINTRDLTNIITSKRRKS